MATAESLLDLARNARAECNTGQRKFSTALPALDALVSELDFYKSVLRKPVNSGALTNLESHLTPCSGALNTLLNIRRKYRSEMSTMERVKWKSTDGEKFTEAVNRLQDATNLLRGTLRMTSEMQQSRTAEKKPIVFKDAVQETTKAKENAKAKPTLCRNGAGSCSFKHPRVAPCSAGVNCVAQNCNLFHPEVKPCRYGIGCTNKSCTFRHPPPPYTKEPTTSVKPVDEKKPKAKKSSANESPEKAKRKPKVKKPSIIPEKETAS
ncbi:hypothetical protein APSETT444_009051 [Aspergillus pseudonomiae]